MEEKQKGEGNSRLFSTSHNVSIFWMVGVDGRGDVCRYLFSLCLETFIILELIAITSDFIYV